MMRNALMWAAVLFTMACSSGSESINQLPGLAADDDAAIRAIVAEWDRLVSAGNIVETVSLLADDYVEMRPVAVNGPQAARTTYEGFQLTYTSATSTVRRLEGAGNLAWAWIEFHARYTRDTGELMAQSGNSLWVMRKGVDGQWKIAATGFQASSRPDSTGG